MKSLGRGSGLGVLAQVLVRGEAWRAWVSHREGEPHLRAGVGGSGVGWVSRALVYTEILVSDEV